jgi:D-sedoheptulose 7-phosphate isomerase
MTEELINDYKLNLLKVLNDLNYKDIEVFSNLMLEAESSGSSVYLCGNGGSAANCIHIVNDFIYGAGGSKKGYSVEALSANSAVITCLANDLGYEFIFSQQLRSKAKKGDLLVALSGSGNSKNIIKAIEEGKDIGMKTLAITGFDGGIASKLADNSIHLNVNNMQIAEDMQLIIGHLCMLVLQASNKEKD